jgi:hypothetical protein
LSPRLTLKSAAWIPAERRKRQAVETIRSNEEKFELAHRRQLAPETFLKVHKVRFAFAVDEDLTA